MLTVYQTVAAILTSPAGSLTYHLILAFSIVWALQSSLNIWRVERYPSARRMAIGLGLLLASRVILFAAGVLVGTGQLLDPVLLPSLDRAIGAIDMILIVWLWAFPEPKRLADAASILLGLLVVTLLALSLTWANAQFNNQPFNETPLNTLWAAFSLVVCVTGIFLLLVRKPPSWEFGLAMLVILGLGQFTQLLWPLPGEAYAGGVRIAQLAAYPILLALPQRYYHGSIPGDARRIRPRPAAAGTSLDLLNQWFEIENAANADAILAALPKFLCQLFQSDAAAVFLPGEASQAQLIIHQRTSDLPDKEVVILEVQAPILWNALHRLRPLRLHASSSSADLESLTEALGMENGNLLAVPVVTKRRVLRAAILLFTVDPSQAWSNEDQQEAVDFARGLALALIRVDSAQALDAPLPESDSQAAQAGTGAADESGLAASAATLTTSGVLLAHLQRENETLREELAQLQAGAPPEQYDQLEQELRMTLVEMARLQQQLSDADHKALEALRVSSEESEHLEVLFSVVQELRQPMSSIMGYTDLLLGESVGILGALQRKFLERIKASTERMGALLDDLVQLTAIENKQLDLRPVEVDLNTVIDEAISHTSARMIEKNIALRVDIPEDLPHIKADQDALQQVVIHLLQNAGAASPVDGEIVLSIQDAQDELHEEHYVLLQVADSGGGIPTEEMPRVFSRLYRADNPLIQGVGDTGVGLSVAKNLVEALNGRIWVDSEMGTGSTFSVLLPISTNGTATMDEDWEFA